VGGYVSICVIAQEIKDEEKEAYVLDRVPAEFKAVGT
jgi:hypothetical protein